MTKRNFIIDRTLFDIIDTLEGSAFTTVELRDIFASRLENIGITGIPLTELRLHVYEHIRRMEKAGWIVADKERRKRDQRYHLRQVPEHLTIELRDGKYHQKPQKTVSANPPKVTDDKDSQIQSLRSQLKELELDMLSSMGEVERYKLLISEMPNMAPQLEPSLLSAREKSSKLIGHFRAIENTLHLIQAS